MTATSVTAAELRSFVERIEELEHQKQDILADTKEALLRGE